MSASNYAKCSHCIKHDEIKSSKVKQLYGKIPLKQFLSKLNETNEEMRNRNEHPLREDYEIYSDYENCELNIYYGCKCELCGFNFEYKKTVEMVNNP